MTESNPVCWICGGLTWKPALSPRPERYTYFCHKCWVYTSRSEPTLAPASEQPPPPRRTDIPARACQHCAGPLVRTEAESMPPIVSYWCAACLAHVNPAPLPAPVRQLPQN